MIRIMENIFWTGYIDWNLRNFHGYSTPSGSTYNAYLLKDEKPTLIDTVKHYGFDEMLHRIQEVLDPKEIRYIISNHTEMDHSGTIDQLLEYCPQAEIVCSPKGAEGLKLHFKKNWNFKVVNSGDELNIGSRTLKFQLMPMVHWPDSMATYSEQDKILFPNDAFGQHFASTERYADEIGLDVIMQEAAKYYANIVLPYGKQVEGVLEAVSSLPIDMICPSHGVSWRRKKDIQLIIDSYQRWATHQTENRVLIAYDTMWHSTEMMAQYIYEDLVGNNIPVKLINIGLTDISDVLTEILSSKFVLFGTPILNNRMLPTMAALVMYLKGLKPLNRFALGFGSYGWATVGFKELESSLQEAGFQLFSEGAYHKFIPDDNDLKKLGAITEMIKSRIPE